MKNKIIYLLLFIAAGFITLKIILKRNSMEAIKLAIQRALKVFPKDIVENAERIFRLETNHFKSGQFLKTLSPGMEKFGEKYPYGWNTLDKIFWSKFPQYKPIGTSVHKEGTGVLGTGGKIKTFLSFPNMDASFFTLCAFLLHYKNNPGRWFSLDANSQQTYNNSIYKINAKFTNELV